jgi:uncharacterized membrane protein YagU involved in acid resistance
MTGIPILDELHLSTQFIMLILWSIVPTILYVILARKHPYRNYWIAAVFFLGWIGLIVALVWDSKHMKG